MYYDLDVYRTVYRVMLEMNRILPNLPTLCRHGNGQRLCDKLMMVLVGIYRLSVVRDKLQTIEQLRQAMVEVSIYLRLMVDLRHISEKKYLELSALSDLAGKQFTQMAKAYRENRMKNSLGEVPCNKE